MLFTYREIENFIIVVCYQCNLISRLDCRGWKCPGCDCKEFRYLMSDLQMLNESISAQGAIHTLLVREMDLTVRKLQQEREKNTKLRQDIRVLRLRLKELEK